MKVIKMKIYTVKDCIKNPLSLFIFGDNVKRYGRGGQAQIRACINSFGIVTKWEPEMNEDSFFSDSEECFNLVKQDFDRLKNLMDKNKYTKLILPEDGLGTGLADLPNHAPKLLEYINKQLLELMNI